MPNFNKVSVNTAADNVVRFTDQEPVTIRQFCTAYSWPSESAMRAYIYRAEELGLSDAFIRIRRRVLVIPAKFFALIKNFNAR